MFLKRGQLPILIVNLIYLSIALFVFSSRKNYEFIMYVGVVILFLALILLTNKKVNYPNSVLWLLTFWGILHMSGGGVLLKDGTMRLYELILIPINEEYQIFRYDQFVHIIGFGVATLIMYVLLKPSLINKPKPISLGIVITMAGLGVGALNEIVEFSATVLVPETGVGGFVNSSLDLVSDLVGAILALVYLRIKNWEI
ncbi:DUF2238 domain-containing protein [Candidatus Pacearchaeota archaeon]|nr:DUF2238 domain-containing protein [Candidatus Pacearchaeota archaeon]